jgi:hypothetical protein
MLCGKLANDRVETFRARVNSDYAENRMRD